MLRGGAQCVSKGRTDFYREQELVRITFFVIASTLRERGAHISQWMDGTSALGLMEIR